MRRILYILIMSAGAVAAAWWLQHLAGDVTLRQGDWTVQAPLSLSIVALSLLLIVFYLVARLLASIFGLPGAFARWGHGSRRNRGEEAVTRTLVALAAREGNEARKLAARARKLLGDTPQTLLLAAYASSVTGDQAETESAFQQLADRQDSAFLGLRGLLRLAINREDFAAAATLAKKAEAAHPGTAWLRTERAQLAVRTQDWSQALQLARDDSSRAVFGAAAAEAESVPADGEKLAKQAWKRDPALPAAALAYARRLREAGREKSALEVLRRSWKLSPTPELAAFALAPATDPLARLNVGKALVAEAPDSAESHFLLAGLSLAVGLLPEARGQAAAAQAAGLNQRRMFLLLADIAQAAGDEAGQRDALRQVAAAESDPAWHCGACGATSPVWHPACPSCHTPGRVAWGVLPQAVVVYPK